MGKFIRAALTLDSDGFLRRCCPYCNREFKWKPTDSTQESSSLCYHCPYCNGEAEPSEWFTKEQKEYLAALAVKGLFTSARLSRSKAPNDPDDMVRLVPGCHSSEPIKVADYWNQPVHCLICGTLFDFGEDAMKWDLFISHASEDKAEVAEPLYQKFTAENLKVWYDDETLTIGDSLRRSIDHGLAQSSYGLVVLSPYFVGKEWTQKELDALVALEDGRRKRILPVWHKITAQDVKAFSPLMADRLAVSTDRGLDFVVQKVLKVFRPNEGPSISPAKPVSGIPSEGIELLKAAAETDGSIIFSEYQGGFSLQAGRKGFGEPESHRSEAFYKSTLRKLRSAGLISQNSDSVYELTDEGYQLLDSLK